MRYSAICSNFQERDCFLITDSTRRLVMSRPSKKTVIVSAAISLLAAFAFSPAEARAADNCLASPAAVAPAGAHWPYRTNRQTHQKCWYIGARIANAQARVPVMAFGDDDAPAQPAARTSCIDTPGAPS